MTRDDILKQIHVNMPFHMLIREYLPLVVSAGINPEIGFKGDDLDGFTRDDFADVARRLRDVGTRITFHAPFMDLRPGAIDERVRRVTLDRLRQVFNMAPLFSPSRIVCHASFDARYYWSQEEAWLEKSRRTWCECLSWARDAETRIVLENVYEDSPVMFEKLLSLLPTDAPVGLCFDTGHFNVFSRVPLDEWIDAVGSSIEHVHLHDNDGTMDAHAPVGEGTFPFDQLFALLEKGGITPTVTLEPHSEEALWRTIDNLSSMKWFDSFLARRDMMTSSVF